MDLLVCIIVKIDFSFLLIYVNKMTDIYIEDYSEASIVVLGDTKTHKEQLKKLGGKFNSKLKDGKVGWIFSKKNETNVREYINNQKNLPLVEKDILSKMRWISPEEMEALPPVLRVLLREIGRLEEENKELRLKMV